MDNSDAESKPVTQRLAEAFRANTDRHRLDDALFAPIFAAARRLLKTRRTQRPESTSLRHADFTAAFVEGQRFLSESGWTGSVTVREVGDLIVTSGRIVACDPNYGRGNPPFIGRIPPRDYPVLLSFVGGRPACAMLRIRLARPVSWEMAVMADQDTDSLEGGQFFGYGVDSGTGSFFDSDQDQNLRRLDDWPASPKDCDADPLASQWAEYVFDEETGGNVITFTSGEGDGSYASYWGLDAAGERVCLCTDFGLLTDYPSMKVLLPDAFRRPPGEVRHHALDTAGLIMEIVPGSVPGRSIVVGFIGPKAADAHATLHDPSGKPVETLASGANPAGWQEGLEFSFRELILPAKWTGRLLEGLGVEVELPLDACAMRAIGAADD